MNWYPLNLNTPKAMKQYTVGTKVFCDYHFGGKPRGVAVEIVKPGTGKDSCGEIRVKLSKSVGAYKKGEIVTVPSWQAVPCAQELKLKSGQFFRRVSTDHEWTK